MNRTEGEPSLGNQRLAEIRAAASQSGQLMRELNPLILANPELDEALRETLSGQSGSEFLESNIARIQGIDPSNLTDREYSEFTEKNTAVNEQLGAAIEFARIFKASAAKETGEGKAKPDDIKRVQGKVQELHTLLDVYKRVKKIGADGSTKKTKRMQDVLQDTGLEWQSWAKDQPDEKDAIEYIDQFIKHVDGIGRLEDREQDEIDDLNTAATLAVVRMRTLMAYKYAQSRETPQLRDIQRPETEQSEKTRRKIDFSKLLKLLDRARNVRLDVSNALGQDRFKRLLEIIDLKPVFKSIGKRKIKINLPTEKLNYPRTSVTEADETVPPQQNTGDMTTTSSQEKLVDADLFERFEVNFDDEAGLHRPENTIAEQTEINDEKSINELQRLANIGEVLAALETAVKKAEEQARATPEPEQASPSRKPYVPANSFIGNESGGTDRQYSLTPEKKARAADLVEKNDGKIEELSDEEWNELMDLLQESEDSIKRWYAGPISPEERAKISEPSRLREPKPEPESERKEYVSWGKLTKELHDLGGSRRDIIPADKLERIYELQDHVGKVNKNVVLGDPSVEDWNELMDLKTEAIPLIQAEIDRRKAEVKANTGKQENSPHPVPAPRPPAAPDQPAPEPPTQQPTTPNQNFVLHHGDGTQTELTFDTPSTYYEIHYDADNHVTSIEARDPSSVPADVMQLIPDQLRQNLSDQAISVFYGPDDRPRVVVRPLSDLPPREDEQVFMNLLNDPVAEVPEAVEVPQTAEAGQGQNAQPAERIDPLVAQAARHRIERYEREAGRQLTAEERRIVELGHIKPEALSTVDKKTLEIFNKYGSIVNNDILTKTTKVSKVIGKVLVTAGAGALIRGALHTVMPFGAGAIAGGVVGGVTGFLRARSAEKDRLHSTQAVIHEYNALKNEQRDPERQSNALAFLQSFLEEGRFKGNLSELLDIMAFYKKEASGFYEGRQVDEQILKTLSENGRGFVVGFERQAAQAIDGKKVLKAAGRGALIGAGLGLASDLIGAWVSHIRSEHAQEAFMEAHSGPSHESSFLNEQPVPKPEDMNYDPQHLEKVAAGLQNNPTDFGNALSHSVRTGFDAAHETLKYPPELSNLPLAEQKKAIIEFIHDLNYSQPSTDNAFVGYHNSYTFNNEALQNLINKAFHGATEGANGGVHVDPHSYLGAIVNADQILTNEFAANLAHGAAEAGREAATQGLAENLIHGAAIGGLTGIKIEQESKRHEESLVGGGGGGAAGAAPAESPPAAGAPAAAAAAAEQAPATAEQAPSDEQIKWNEIEGNQNEFESAAKNVIAILGEKGYDPMTDQEKANLDALLKFACDNSYQMKFKSANGDLGELVSYDEANDQKILKVKLQGNTRSLDLKTSAATAGFELTTIRKVNRAGGGEGGNRRNRRRNRNS